MGAGWQIGFGTATGGPGRKVTLTRVVRARRFDPKHLAIRDVDRGRVTGMRVWRDGAEIGTGTLDPVTGAMKCASWHRGDEVEIDVTLSRGGKLTVVVVGVSR